MKNKIFIILCTVVLLLSFTPPSVFSEDIQYPTESGVNETLSILDLSIPLQNCFQNTVRFTEIGFDGTDEWLEITNVGLPLQDIALIISGAKNKQIVLSGFSINSGESIILGDTLAAFSGYQGQIFTGLGLSLPDSTGFSLQLQIYDITNTPCISTRSSLSGETELSLLDLATFSSEEITAIPNDVTLNLSYSDQQPAGFFRKPTQPGEENYIIDGVLANPGEILFSRQQSDQIEDPQSLSGEGSFEEPGFEDSLLTGESSIDIPIDTPLELPETPPLEPTTGSTTDTPNEIEPPTNSEGLNDTPPAPITNTGEQSPPPQTEIATGTVDELPIEDLTGVITASENQIDTELLPPTPPVCTFSEIHSVVDQLPEYFELFCESGFSGEMLFAGIGVGSSIKTLSMKIPTGGYAVFTSNPDAILQQIGSQQLDDLHQIIYLAGISLADAGEVVSFSSTDGLDSSIHYPSMKKGQSYYPICFTATNIYEIFSQSTPTTEHLCQIVQPPLQQISSQQTIQTPLQIFKPTPVKTTSKTTSTKTSIKTTVPSTKKISSSKPVTTTKASTKSTTKTTSSKPSSQPKTKTNTSTLKKTTSKSPTKKATTTKTTSKTTKASQVMQKENEVYKNYIAFLHSYLKSHLYTQYDALQLNKMQTMYKKSLQKAKQNSILIELTGGQTVSTSDFKSHWAYLTGEPISFEKVFQETKQHLELLGDLSKKFILYPKFLYGRRTET